MTTDTDKQNHVETLRKMHDDMHWLISNSTGSDRRRIDRYQLTALEYAIRVLESTPTTTQGLRNALTDIAEHSGDEVSQNRAAEALAHETEVGPWNRAKATLELALDDLGDLTIDGRAGTNMLSMTMRRTGITAYAWHDSNQSSGHSDVTFKPEVYSVLRTIVSLTTRR